MYEVFEHTADVGLRIRAESREAVFVDAARGLFSLIVVNPDQVRPRVEVSLDVPGSELDYLLFDWLRELLYRYETEHLLLADFDVRLDDAGLHATARGEPLDADRHRLDHEVKAITYHGLVFRQEGSQWLAEVIVDI